MIPTEVVMAIAVESAPTSTEVRRSEDAKLRPASMASTPPMRRSTPEEIAVRLLTSAGIANADAAMNRRAEAYPKNGLPAIAGANEAAIPADANASAIHRSRILWTRAAYSRPPRAIASTGDTSDASRAGEAADASDTPIPIAIPRSITAGVSAMGAGVLLT